MRKATLPPYREIAIEALRKRFRYDPTTGDLFYLTGPKAGLPARAGKTYVEATIDNQAFKVHRIALALTDGEWPTQEIDHVNGDKRDNRLSNLRQCSRSENLSNRGPHRTNRIGRKGVVKHRSGWQATIKKDRTKYILGTFNSPEEASAAYAGAARILYGPFVWRGDAARKARAR